MASSSNAQPAIEALIVSMEDNIDQLLKEQLDLDEKGNNLIYAYITHLGLYVLLYNVLDSMLEAHREHRNWVFVAVVLLGVRLIVEFCIYYLMILNMWRLFASLLKRLRATREEAGSLVGKIETHQKRAKDQEDPDGATVLDVPDERGKAKAKVEMGKVGSPSQQESTSLETLFERAMAIAALSDFDGSMSNFYLKYLLQLVIPLMALVVVIIVTAYVASKHVSGKTLAAPVPPAPTCNHLLGSEVSRI